MLSDKDLPKNPIGLKAILNPIDTGRDLAYLDYNL